MATAAPQNSVWTAMAYVPPKGRCNYKSSLMSPACPCLRFMLHPVKAATSFDCDGCNHHASFHSLENPAEDVILQKWSEQQYQQRDDAVVAAVQHDDARVDANKKRKLITQGPAYVNDEVEVVSTTTLGASSTRAAHSRGAVRKKATATRPTARTAKGRRAGPIEPNYPLREFLEGD